MNWTGGRLSRHSGTSNPVKDRQRQHYARVQQFLHSGPKKHSPIKWSFFDHVVEDRERRQWEFSAAEHESPRAYGRQESQSSRQHQDSLLSDRDFAPQHGTRRSSRSQNHSHSGQKLAFVKKKLHQVPDDGLYDATPPPWKTKRPQEVSIPRSEMENLADQDEEESVSEKRRKILRRGDWVGINIQRPLQLAFSSSRKDEKIGRRRKLADGHRARYTSKQIHITSPFPTKYRMLANQSSSQEGLQRREPTKTDVRISIGGRVVPPGISSSSVPCKMGSHSTVARRRSQTTSSDVMLLDADASITQESPWMGTSNFAARNYSASIPHIASRSQDLMPIKTSLPDEVEQGDHTSHEAEDRRNGWAGAFSGTSLELHHNVQDSRDVFEVYPHSQKTSRPPSKDYNKDHHHGRLIFSSSSASILHPAPRSSKVSVLLRSASSEIAESTVAQVGKVKPVVPSSQILENEIWETWIAPELKIDQPSDNAYLNGDWHLQRISISPGISTGPATWHGDTTRVEGGEDNSSHLQRSYSDEREYGSERSNVTISAISIGRKTESSSLAQETGMVEIVETTIEEGTQKASPADEELPKATGLNVSLSQDIIDEDQKESWTKFVFGGNGDEVDGRILTPKLNAVQSQRGQFCGTSTLGQTSGDVSAPLDINATIQDTNTHAVHSTISRGTSRITEASPCLTGSRCRESDMDMIPTINSSTRQGDIYVRAKTGSFLGSSSDSVSASVAVQAMSQYSLSDPAESTSANRPQRKVTFTKPKRFMGRKANPDFLSLGKPLHIGRSLRKDDERSGLRRKGERDKHGLRGPVDQDDQDDQEVNLSRTINCLP